jgi:hypothetical protein
MERFSDKFQGLVHHVLSSIGERLDKRTKGKVTTPSQPIPVTCLVEETAVASRTKRDSATTAKYLQSIHHKKVDTHYQSVAGVLFPVIQIEEDEEPNEEQSKAMWKLNISRSMLKGKGKKTRLGRSSELDPFRTVSYGIKRAADRDHKINLLHLRGVLSEEAKIGQLILAHIHVYSVEGGWSKGCQAEGRYEPDLLSHWLKRRKLHKKWGMDEQATMEEAYVTKTGGSMRLFYTNGKGEREDFQVRW